MKANFTIPVFGEEVHRENDLDNGKYEGLTVFSTYPAGEYRRQNRCKHDQGDGRRVFHKMGN